MWALDGTIEIFWVQAQPMRTTPYGESVILLAPPWVRFTEVHQRGGYAPAWY